MRVWASRGKLFISFTKVRSLLRKVLHFLTSLSVIDARKRAKLGKANGSQYPVVASTSSVDQSLSQSLFDERAASPKKAAKPTAPRLSAAEVKALEQERQAKIDASYEMCKRLHDKMMDRDYEAESEWLIEAEKLVEHFRETRQLFITAKVGLWNTRARLDTDEVSRRAPSLVYGLLSWVIKGKGKQLQRMRRRLMMLLRDYN